MYAAVSAANMILTTDGTNEEDLSLVEREKGFHHLR